MILSKVDGDMQEKIKFNSIEEAIEDIRRGSFVIVVDDEDRENEGDLIMSAETVSADSINFFSKHGRGLICVPMEIERMKQLDLHPMVSNNTARLGTRFTVSVDAFAGTTTGISVHDRAATIKALADDSARPEDFGRPGHIFPIEAVNGGVMARPGHTEATIDLSKLAGFKPIGILCEILDDDGSMARLPRLERMAKEFGIKIICIKDLIRGKTLLKERLRLISRLNSEISSCIFIVQQSMVTITSP